MKIIILTALLNLMMVPVFAQECGKASWYALYGNRTANGEIMQPGFSAAHKYLAFGTIVKITNSKNGKNVKVRINDRGPFIKGRIVDVNKTVAEFLGFRRKGVTNVCLEIVE